MKRLLGIGALTLEGVLAIASANAADIYAPAGSAGLKDEPVSAYSWTGVYAGIKGSGVWGTQNVFFPGYNTQTKPEFKGGALGGQAGMLYQFGNNVVLGAEVSAAGSGASGSANCPTSIWVCQAKVTDAVEVVGRIGYALENFLPYFKGGYANVRAESTIKPPFPGFNDSHSLDGWTVGGGLEYALTHSIVIGVDYSHIDTGMVTYSPAEIPGVMRKVSANIDLVSARAGYKIPSEYVPLK
jgi:outer membrane immunogenic protein